MLQDESVDFTRLVGGTAGWTLGLLLEPFLGARVAGQFLALGALFRVLDHVATDGATEVVFEGLSFGVVRGELHFQGGIDRGHVGQSLLDVILVSHKDLLFLNHLTKNTIY